MFFSKNFNRAAINVLVKDEEFHQVIEKIPVKFFDDDKLSAKYFKMIRKLYRKYRKINEKMMVEEYGQKVGRLFEMDYEDIEEYVKLNIRRFVYVTGCKKIIDDIVEEGERDFRDIDEEKLRETMLSSEDYWVEEKSQDTIFYFKDSIKSMMSIQDREGVPTGIFDLDRRMMGGGLCPGELGILTGDANAGKSATLGSFGLNGVVHCRNVAYITLEMEPKIVSHRMDMRIGGMTNEEVFGNFPYLLRRKKDLEKITKSDIIIQGMYPEETTIYHVEKFLNSLKRNGIDVGLLLIDYADMLSPMKRYNNDSLGLKEIYNGLKTLARKRMIPVWTPSKSTRLSAENGGSAEQVMGMNRLAGSSWKEFIADVIISINQTDAQKNANEAYFYLAKNRNDSNRIGIKLYTDWERMLILDRNTYDMYYGKKNPLEKKVIEKEGKKVKNKK